MNHPYNDENFLTALQQVFDKKPLLLTSLERQWLHYLLLNEQASYFLTDEQINIIQQMLGASETFQGAIIEKRRPKTHYPNDAIYQQLTTFIEQKNAMQIDYQFITGERFKEEGIPYKLYFSIHHERWYIWWIKLDEGTIEDQRRRTPLSLVNEVTAFAIDSQMHEHYTNLLKQQVQPIKELTFLIQPLYASMDEQWILQAFSSFKKHVQRKEGQLSITIYYAPEDEAYMLSKIREFGPHVYVIAPKAIQEKMLQSAKKAKSRYFD